MLSDAKVTLQANTSGGYQKIKKDVAAYRAILDSKSDAAMDKYDNTEIKADADYEIKAITANQTVHDDTINRSDQERHNRTQAATDNHMTTKAEARAEADAARTTAENNYQTKRTAAGLTADETAIVDAKIKLARDLEDIAKTLEQTNNKINQDATLTDAERNRQKAEAESQAKENRRQSNDNYHNLVDPLIPQAPRAAAVDSFLQDFAPYAHPNWVSQQAVADMLKAVQTAQRMVGDFKRGEGVEDFNKGDFFKAGGLSESQEEFYKALGKDTEAMAKLTESLTALTAKANLSDREKNMVKELKKGLASFMAKGGDGSKLMGVIKITNTINATTDSSKPDKTVEEYQADFTSKK